MFQRRADGNRTPRQRDTIQRSLEKSSVPATVVDMVKLQQFDGSFSPMSLDFIRPLVGNSIIDEAQRLTEVESDVWVTIVCVAYLRKQLEHNPELLDNLLVKTLEYLRGRGGVDIDALLERAAMLVQ
jgi:hypothetical protein